MLKQMSVFIENKPGRLARVCRVMSDENINIRALSIADTADFGLLRLIVDNPELAEERLKARGFMVSVTDVVGIKVFDRPGGLAEALDMLEGAGVSVEYLYAFIARASDQAVVVMRLSDNEKGKSVFAARGVELLMPEEVYGL